jgi:hypothetical protein
VIVQFYFSILSELFKFTALVSLFFLSSFYSHHILYFPMCECVKRRESASAASSSGKRAAAAAAAREERV